MQRVLNQLIEKLQKTYGDRLVSTVLYGSAAVGDHQGRFSDINILCILTRVTPRELADSEPIFRWWRELGNPAPLLLAEDELRRSTDAFAIEFHDIRERHRILAGKDVVAGLHIDYSHHRAELEHELRSKFLRLRTKAAGVLSDKPLLLQLMTDSVSTFATLFRHALLLAGTEAKWQKREIIAGAAERFEINAEPFEKILDLREEKVKARDVSASALFERYLNEIGRLIEAVDMLEKHAPDVPQNPAAGTGRTE